MKFLHFINSLLLILFVLAYSLSQLMPNHLKDRATVPSDTNVFDTVRFHVAQPAVEAWARISDSKTSIILSCAVIILNGVIVSILILFFNKKSKDRISIEVPGGKVSITISAVEDSLRRALKGEPQIKDSRVFVNASGSKISVTARVTLLETENLKHLDENIIAHMKTHFEKIFPVQKPVNYEVVIRRLKQSGTPMGITTPAKAEPVALPSAPVVKQPQYPSEVNDDNKEA